MLGKFRSDTTALRTQLDSARSRLQQHTTQLGQTGAGTQYLVAPEGADPATDKAAAYESLRDQGYSHEDAVNLIERAGQP